MVDTATFAAFLHTLLPFLLMSLVLPLPADHDPDDPDYPWTRMGGW